jgi:hypothetical protein
MLRGSYSERSSGFLVDFVSAAAARDVGDAPRKHALAARSHSRLLIMFTIPFSLS